MKINFDATVQAAYISLEKTKVVRTIRVGSVTSRTMVMADLDKHGRVVGIEIIGETLIELEPNQKKKR